MQENNRTRYMTGRSVLMMGLGMLMMGTAKAQGYWQQKVDTKIDVTLDDKKHMLRGFETFSYTNNSPDTLRYIYVHLWPNAYSHDHTEFAEQQYRNGKKDFYYAKESERGFIDSLDFTVDGKSVLYFSTDNLPDIARIDLPAPLAPGATMQVATPFRVKLPKVFSRLGHTGQAYFISQWFPKPAVYDRKGWHPMPYLDLGEFYSEIGSYDVNVTLPKNYVVMGTGNILDESENRWLDSLAAIDTSLLNVHVKKPDSTPRSSEEWKTIRFHEDNVHDFAWFADKRWIVRKDSVASPGTGDMVYTYSAFLPSYKRSWMKGNEHLKDAVRYYGKWVGPYPYKTIKAVQGDMSAGGGMEYPTVTIIDRSLGGNEMVIVHEAGHNWFYGILASNERDHAWLDEGLNTYYEQKTTRALAALRDTARQKRRKSAAEISIEGNSVIAQLAAAGLDKPIDQTSVNFPEINYGLDVYYKTAYLLNWLEAYVGKEAFEAGMHQYYNDWKHRHPYPEDFRASMQKHTTKDIGWFFDALRSDRLYDFAIKDINRKGDCIEVIVKNKTGLRLPVIIEAVNRDSVLTTSMDTVSAACPGASENSEPFTGKKTIYLDASAADWTKVRISRKVPDWRTPNNEYRRGGFLFHRSGLRLAPVAGTSLGNRRKIHIAPGLGYNMYDGFMLGPVFHNLSWPQTRFRVIAAPLYGFKSRQWNGAASMGYNWFPKTGVFREVMVQADLKSFHYNDRKSGYNSDSSVYVPENMFLRYAKIAPFAELTFRQPTPLSKVTRKLLVKGYAINEESFDFSFHEPDSTFRPSKISETSMYGLIRYSHNNDRPFNPFSYSLEGQMGEYFAKLNLEGKIRIDYHRKNKALHIRGFAGKFFTLKDEAFVTDRYYLNTSFTGVNDYLYDDTYIGRTETEGFGARQVSLREGGFKIPTPLYSSPLGRSDNWLLALNVKTDLPVKLPVRLFLDVATFSDAKDRNPSGEKLLYDAGIELFTPFDILQVYIPLVRSKDFNDYRKSIAGSNSIFDDITFSLNLSRINWLKAPSGVIKLFGY